MKISRNVTTADLTLFAKRLRSMNERTNIPFYIFAPDYRDSSGGIRVLHYLCHILNEMGEEAYIVNAKKTSPHLRTPKLTYSQLEQHFLAGLNPATIYPEIIWKNPANTPIIVRWLLNIPGHLGKPLEFEAKDIICFYEAWCMPPDLQGQQLFIHPVNHVFFHNDNNPDDKHRTLECYYANKYFLGGKPILDEHKSLISLGQDIKRSHKEIAAIFRKAKVLYCYEPSGIISEAQACGCPVILVRSEYWPLGPDDTHHHIPGLAIHGEPDSLARARESLRRIPETHMKARDNSWTMTRQMVEAVYRAEADLKTNGKPLLNKLQQLWALASEDRIVHVAQLRKYYEDSGIHLAEIDASETKPELDPEQQYAAYIAASTEKIRDIATATITANQVLRPATPDTPEVSLPDTLITIVVRTTNKTLHLLANTLDSLAVTTPCWQLVVVSNLDEPAELEGIASIHWVSASSSEERKSLVDQAVATLRCTWVIEMPSGTILTDRLFQQLQTIDTETVSAVFFDDDLYDDSGKQHSPRFKPGVNPEALRSTDLAGAICVKREHWLETGGTWQNGETSWYYKLLKVAHAYGWKSIKHVPQVLLSYAERYRSNSDACLLAIDQHLQESGSDARISLIDNDSWSILQNLPSPPPSVDVFIYTQGDLGLIERCLTSLTEITTYPNFQVGLTVDTNEADPDLEAWLDIFAAKNPRAPIIRKQANESFAAMANQAMAGSAADYSLFMNDESVAIQKEWLDELVRACSQDGVSGASPRLLKSGTKLLENTGYVLGLNGWRAPAFCGQANIKLPGQFDWIDCTRDITTLTSSCFIVRNSAVTLAGQMDAEKFSDQMAIADLSLRLFDSGQRLLYVPRANLAGSSELPAPLDGTLEVQMRYLFERKKNAESFQKRWWPRYANDPFWNPNLSLIENTPTPEIEYFADWFLGDEGKPKILTHVVANAQADFRVTSPLHALRKKNLVSTCVWKQRLFAAPRYHTVSELSRLNPDVHIVQNYIHDNALAAMNEWQKMRHRPFTIYALDDVITDIDPSNPFFKNFSANSRTRLKYALARCDRMVVSTDFLADLYQHLIADIRVVPNRLEMEKWLPLRSKKRTGKKPRVGWAGGTTHQRDLLLLKEVIEQTRDEADWIFFGMCPEEILPLIKESYPFVPFEDYPAFLASLNFDIAVAPLADTIFNRGKSNLRLLELGILGLPVICTDIDPYRDSPACRVDNTVNAWVSALRERIHDAEARETEGGTMRRWVTEKFLLENHLDDWLAAHMPN